MICASCRRTDHDDCKGGTWCDCQHGVKKTRTRARSISVDLGCYDPPDQHEHRSNGASGE